MSIIIFSNNPDVLAAHPAHTRAIDGGVADVFVAVRDAVHLGARLVSHPLSGSLKPNETPYKSVALSTTQGQFDEKSLHLIENAITTLAKFPKKNRVYSERILQDYRVIDLDLMSSINFLR